MSLFLIILAAGDSTRLKSNTPKQYQTIKSKTLLEHSIHAFDSFREIKKIIVVVNKKHYKYFKKLKLKKIIKITGGKSRQESTFKALKRIKNMNCKKILIHDAARPFPPKALIKNIIYRLKKNDAVVPVIQIDDATKRVKKNIIFKNIQRNSLKFSQTPQGFTFKKIFEKHKKNINTQFDDDSALFTKDKEKVLTVAGRKINLKITDKEDFNISRLFKNGKIYYGIGFDIHKLIKGRKLFLGGVKIPSALGLKGHSDADPVLHALIDGLLGACKLGNIGILFSDKNKKYKNIRSTILLKKTINKIKSKNFLINNIDINVITQKPKISVYSNKMKNVICKICGINLNQINIKGKTTEKLGIIGREKAIAAEAIVSVIKYDERI